MLFNPERQAHAADVAAGFAVILLPVLPGRAVRGVLLDRWWRQRVLAARNLLRARRWFSASPPRWRPASTTSAFYVSALVVVSVNRFFLSALSASLPHVVDTPELVTANALSTTSGGIAATLGGAFGIASGA